MKRQIFLPYLTIAVLLTGMNAYSFASSQFSEERLTVPIDVSSIDAIDALSNACGYYDPFEGIELTPKQEQFVQAEMDHYNSAFDQIDTEIQAIEDDFFARLEQGLRPEQIQQMRDNEERIAREIEADIQQQDFENWFARIELTPEQERFVLAEIARYNGAFEEMFDRAEVEGRNFITDAEVQTVEDNFFARLEQSLTSKQIQQVQDNMECD